MSYSFQAKSKKSRAPVPIIPNLAARLTAHKKTQNNPTTGPVFRNGKGKAVDPDSVLHRVIQPALDVCGVCSKMKSEHTPTSDHEYERNKVLPQWCGWHAFRRGLGTNLHRLGVDDLSIQAILRHSNVAVTQKCYIKTASEESHAAMQKFEAALNATQVPPIRRAQATKGVM